MNGQPYSISYGPWAPDLADVAVQIQSQYGATEVPCADVLNVYYSNGAYRSLPSALSAGASALAHIVGAYTYLDPTGAAIPIAGTAGGLAYSLTSPTSDWVETCSSPGSPTSEWSFAQFNETLYAQAVPTNSFNGLTGNLYAVQPGVSENAVPGAPIGTVLAVVGQFLMVGDICGPLGVTTAAAFTGSISGTALTVTAIPTGTINIGSDINGVGVTVGTKVTAFVSGTNGATGIYTVNNSQTISSESMTSSGKTLIGVGDGGTTAFSGTLNNVPAYPRSVSVQSAIDNPDSTKVGAGYGQLIGIGIDTGNTTPVSTVNYNSGAVSVHFLIAPANGTLILADSGVAYRSRVQWPAIGNPQSWPIPLTDAAIAAQSSYEDLEGEYGPIQFIAGYPLYAVIFQKSAITRATYVGGQVVFQFATYARNQGLAAKGAAVQVGPLTYFLADSGFFVTDGANVSPVGTASDNSAGIDQWFWDNVNQSVLGTITASYDARMRCVIFAIPTGSNILSDTLLILNTLSGRWTRASVAAPFIWVDSDGTTERIGIFNDSWVYNTLTGPLMAGYLESCDVTFTDGNTRYVNAVRPNINCTDIPTVTVGYRNTLEAPVLYSQAMAKDRFSGIAPFLVCGIYLRARLASAAASSFHGLTMFMAKGGEV